MTVHSGTIRHMTSELVTRAELLLIKSRQQLLHSPLSEVQKTIEKLELVTTDPQFWQQSSASQTMQELAVIKTERDEILALQQATDDVAAALELSRDADKSQDSANLEATEAELRTTYQTLKQRLQAVEQKQYLSGPYDRLGCLFSVHSGQGGVEAMDWADMVNRMYTR